ncbi:hypothetical protein Smic_28390 [Streptomyces microflavus]|uniref:Transcriptional regulator n=1 Tax=Streptomyces microflavus TaxID=1919 RepID=A0A7J0CP60_STRMI|nr:hypothetical protein Smic_28390 [Streptomyces microflavus]
MRDHFCHDGGVLAHRATARGHTRPGGPEFRPRGGAPPRPRRGGLPRRGPEPPDPVGVGDILGSWAGLTGEPDVVFQGGPVSLDSALGVAVIPGDEGPLGWRRVHGAIGLVDLETPPELLGPALGSLRIFAGYAGWGPGQLEGELGEGAWYVVESEPGDVSSRGRRTSGARCCAASAASWR